MLIKPNSQWLAVLILVLSNLVLIRQLGRDRLRVALARMYKVGWIFIQPGTWFRVVRLLTAPEIQPVVRAHPRIVLKYLGGYLGEGLSRNERASILVNHYAFLKRRVAEDFFSKIVDGRLELWKHAVGNLLFRIYLTFSRENHDEGELSLIFQSDHVEIYTLSFTIGPGSVAGLPAGHAIYVGRMQGKGGVLHLIREATKNCLDISPAALLLAAAEGIAMALEIRHVVGMGADQQVSAEKDSRPEGLVHAYDQFWMALGGVKMDRNMYLLSTPLSEKPIKTIKQNHRSRTLRKRAFKKLVKEQVRHEFGALALRPRDQ